MTWFFPSKINTMCLIFLVIFFLRSANNKARRADRREALCGRLLPFFYKLLPGESLVKASKCIDSIG